MKIAVTGANGFLGKNFCRYFNKEHEVLEISRTTSNNKLKKICNEADILFHFAGEVRPDATDKQYKLSNVIYTDALLNILDEKPIPVVLSSTIHAKFKKNMYGKTKFRSEQAVLNYAKKNNVESYIYRLPHLFGEHSKPEHNSVLTTWVHKIIKEEEIEIFDENIKLNYLYVGDLLKNFENLINHGVFEEKNIVHEISLIELSKKIKEIVLNNAFNSKNSFEENLKKTISFIKKEY